MRNPPLNTPDDAKAALRLFNSKLERILSYSFFQCGIRFSAGGRVGDVTKTSADCASDEQIDAVLLHFRFFSAINENSSFHHLPTAYSILAPSPAIRDYFDGAYNRWMGWRNAPSGIQNKTNFEFMAIMQFGERVHRNDATWTKVYDEWMRTPLLADISIPFFCLKINELTQILQLVGEANMKAIPA